MLSPQIELRLFINLTPWVPLSMIGVSSLHEGEKIIFEGALPLQPSPNKQPQIAIIDD
jgi:hypothetical protein